MNRISIDTINKKIAVQYYDIYHGQHEKEFLFSELRVRIRKSKMKWWSSSLSIELINKKVGNFSISKEKDGFSPKVLEELSKTLESLTVSIR